MKALPIEILKAHSGSCSNHGISEKFNEILLICPDGFIEVDENNPPKNLCKVVERDIFGEKYYHVEPVERPTGIGWMFGGCSVDTSDSRFRRIARYPLHLHDRQEGADDCTF